MSSSLPTARSSRFRPQLLELEARVNPVVGYAVADGMLISFDTDNVAAASAPISLTGVNGNETLVGVDFRPQNGMLYGLGYNPIGGTVQLYGISTQSGVATPIGATGQFVSSSGTPVRIGVNANTRFDIDFNPTVDRLRVITSEGSSSGAGQNFRINPNTGAFMDGDLGGSPGTVTGLNMDGDIKGATTTVQATAYTNNSANASATTQYTLDDSTGQLYIQNSPNSGTQGNAIALTFNDPSLTLGDYVGFDINSDVTVTTSGNPVDSGVGFAVVEALDASFNSVTLLLRIDLTTGEQTSLGQFTGVTSATPIRSFALQPDQPAGAPIVALTTNGTQLIRFSSSSPNSPTTPVNITGVANGETLVGIDYRPATGQLMGLGINPTTDRGTLYIIDPQTGGSTLAVISTSGAVQFRDGSGVIVQLPSPATTGYGIDFNPVADRLRVTTSTGLNFRVSPINGAGVDGDFGTGTTVGNTNPDGPINGLTSGVSATAYTNSFAQIAGSGVTTQYTLDAATSSLFIQNTPNSGNQTSQIQITLGGSRLLFDDVNGFNIPTSVQVTNSNDAVTEGSALASLTIAGSTSLYSINLVTGEATLIGAIGNGTASVSGLASGQLPVGSVSLTATDFTVTEGSNLTVTITRSGGTAGSFTVTLTPLSGTADESDFDPTPITVTFADGQTQATATIPIIGGDGPEGAETFSLILEQPTNGAVIGAISVANVTILANGSGGGGGGGPVFGDSPARVVGTGIGLGTVLVYNADGSVRFNLTPYGGYLGGVSVDQGDVNGDGIDDIITGTNTGGAHVKVFNGSTGVEIFSFLPYAGNFLGGINVALADVNQDGFDDLLVGAGAGGNSHVKVFNALDLSEIYSFFAYAPGFAGGITIAGGDVNGDGFEDIVTGTTIGPGHVKGFDGSNGFEIASFFAFSPSLQGGVNVAVTNQNIFAGAGINSGGVVRIFDVNASQLALFSPYSAGFTGEIRVGVGATGNLVTGTGPGTAPHVKEFSGSLIEVASFFAGNPLFNGGIFVG